jgi:hypothetical protein
MPALQQDVLAALRPRLAWLARSGIQAPPGAPDAGGVHAWLDETTGERAFLYSEITGYFMTLAVHMARWDKNGDWLRQAEAAGSWIVDQAMDESGAVLARKYGADALSASDASCFTNRRGLFFDCAMVGYGLCQLAAATTERRWWEAARRLGDFCLRAFESSDRMARYAIYDLRAGHPAAPADRWSRHFGPFQLKGIMFLDTLSRATGDTRYRTMGDRILSGALAAQKPSGRFPTTLCGETTHLHPHTYTIEGLLYLVANDNRHDLMDNVARALDFTFSEALRPGHLLQQWSESPDQRIRGVRCDALAQSLRAYHLAKWLRPALSWKWETDLLALDATLRDHFLPSGGTSYGQDENGVKSHHANAWCHFFAIEKDLAAALSGVNLGVQQRPLIIT